MQETFKDIISNISQERNINEEIVLNTLQALILDYAAKKYGNRDKLKLSFNANGSCDVYIERTVVNNQKTGHNRSFFNITLADAQKRMPSAQEGDTIKEILPFKLENSQKLELLKNLKITLKQQQKKQEFATFHDKIGTILTGCVKSVDATEVIVSFTDHVGEVGIGVLKRNKIIKTDSIKYNNYIKVYIEDIRPHHEHQIILSRTHPNFLKELLKLEVPEIAEGLISIKSIARDPGSLAKVAVHTDKLSLNPIKVCIGDRGFRAHNLTRELSGEKVIFVIWKPDIKEFIANALSPATILRVTETSPSRYNAVVADSDFSMAMGRRGQNVYLAKSLSGAKSITLLTDSEEQEKTQTLIETQTKNLMDNLCIEEMMARLLISENFETAEIIANSTCEEIAKLEGFDEEISQILISRSQEFLVDERKTMQKEYKKQNVEESLFKLKALSNEHIKALVQKNILSASDIAILDTFELIELFDSIQITLDEEMAGNIIMAARKLK